jgi:hypothetical protein
MSQIALYAGWYDGQVSGPFTRPRVEFMPGAFAYHLHSFSAHTLRSTNQNWCGPLLAEGVTATMGCIDEPYLDGHPRHDGQFFSRWLLGIHFWRGRLRRPAGGFLANHGGGRPAVSSLRAEIRKKLHEELVSRHSPWVEWSILRWVNLELVHNTPMAHCGGLSGNRTRHEKERHPHRRTGPVVSRRGQAGTGRQVSPAGSGAASHPPNRSALDTGSRGSIRRRPAWKPKP